MAIEQDSATWKATEISQLSGFRVFEIAAVDADTPFPDAKTQQAIWKRVAPHAVENLLIFTDTERTRSAWLWMKREGSADSPTRRAKTHPRRHHYLKGQPGDLFLSKLASLVVDLSELDEDGNIPITETAKRVRAGLDIKTVTKPYAKIKVPDQVFADLFALFGRYSWSLNDTLGGESQRIISRRRWLSRR